MKKTLLGILTLIAFGANAQNVNIPDANFKAYLVSNTSINTNADTEIQVSEANAYSGDITCSSLNISDLTGIESFTSLTELTCNFNNLSSVDISQNTALLRLQLASNSLNNIDISQNINLTRLICPDNNLTSIDISNHTNIDLLSCGNNALTSLNVANGNNSNFIGFIATGNPNLTCIEVDDVAYSTTNWTNIDPAASFNSNCGALSTIDFEHSKNISVYPNPVKSQINLSTDENIRSVSIIEVSGKVMKRISTDYKLINVSNLSNGIYFIRIDTDKGTAIKKFIKE